MKIVVCALICFGFLSSVKADMLYYNFTGEITGHDAMSDWGDIIGSPVSYTFLIDSDRQGFTKDYGIEKPVSGSNYCEFADNVWFSGYMSVPMPAEGLDWRTYHYGTSTEIQAGIWSQWIDVTILNGSSWVEGQDANIRQAAADGCLFLTSKVTLSAITPVPESNTISLLILGFITLGLIFGFRKKATPLL